MERKKLDSPVYVRRLFLLCWLAYCVSYIGRLNYSSAMTAMIGDGTLTSTQAGFISMVYFFSYGIGQLINGFLADTADPRGMILTGLAGSALANAGMGLAGQFAVMGLMWGMNGYLQAMIWVPILRIFAEMLNESDKMLCGVNIQTSCVSGTLIAYVLSAALLAGRGWRSVFFAAAVLLLAAAVVFFAGFQKILAYADAHGTVREASPEKSDAPRKKSGFFRLLIGSDILLIFVPALIHGVLKDGVTAWVPTYISKSFGLAPAFSSLLTTILPVVNLLGAYIGWKVYRKMKENVSGSNFVFFSAAAAALVLLLWVGHLSALLTTVLLAVITCSMMAVNTLIITIYPMRFEKQGRVASVSGFLNATAYIGCAISTFVVGVLVESGGWNATIATWLAVTVLAMAVSFFTIKALHVAK